MLQPLFFPPPSPGFQPPQVSPGLCLMSVLLVVVCVFLGLCLAARQIERERMKHRAGLPAEYKQKTRSWR